MGIGAFAKPLVYMEPNTKSGDVRRNIVTKKEHRDNIVRREIYVDYKYSYECKYCNARVRFDEIKNGCCPNCGAPIRRNNK